MGGKARGVARARLNLGIKRSDNCFREATEANNP
jgi:hypothetical protein